MVFQVYFSDYLKQFNKAKPERWNYHLGCVVLGAQYLYETTGSEGYLSTVLNFGKNYVDDNGMIKGFRAEEHNVDMMASGRLLYFLYDYTKEERYLKGIHRIMEALRKQPRTSFGSFWHKEVYPGQVWLDGLYMVQPFYMEYENRFNRKSNYPDILNQFKNVKKYLYDQERHLYYHGYDERKETGWANKDTGRSPSFWLRGMGWYLMALCDCYEISQDQEAEAVLGALLKEAVDGILSYADENTGLFYQVIDRQELAGNYLETSGSAMVAYAVLKGCRLGILDRPHYFGTGERILAALESEKIEARDGRFYLTGICASGGLGLKDGIPGEVKRDGSPEYYLSEAVKDDNAHGAAACMMAYSEWLKAGGTKKVEIVA
ncbi:MAG: glycosyl hydrolase family 88 [Hungatella sp.]|nr:glycosyl hydrolase family 88 [Hungatella sp.]